MAVDRHIETTQERGSTEKAAPFNKERRRSFIVHTNSIDTEDTIAAHASTPDLGDSHPDDAFAICVGRQIKQVDDSNYDWIISCRYATDWENVESETDPNNFRQVVTWGTQFVQTVLTKDVVTDEAIVNTAGDPFDPPLMTDRPLTTCNITTNANAIPTWLFSLRNKVNDAALTIRGVTVPKKTALIRGLTISDERYKNGTLYYRIEIELLIDEQGHDVKVLNDGLHELDTLRSGTEKRTHIMFDGEPISQPVPLDADGKRIDSDDLPMNAIILNFAQYAEADFSVLNLPA